MKPKFNESLVTQKISNEISTNKSLLNFEKSSPEQASLFYTGISFGLLAENAILQRTNELLPLEILAVSACTNFHLSCEFLLRFILEKLGTKTKEAEKILDLFLKLPKKIGDQIIVNFDFESKFLNSLPPSTNLLFYVHHPELLQIYHFFNIFQRKIQAIAMDVEQNNFYA